MHTFSKAMTFDSTNGDKGSGMDRSPAGGISRQHDVDDNISSSSSLNDE